MIGVVKRRSGETIDITKKRSGKTIGVGKSRSSETISVGKSNSGENIDVAKRISNKTVGVERKRGGETIGAQANNSDFWRSSEGGRRGLKERGSMEDVAFVWIEGVYIGNKPLNVFLEHKTRALIVPKLKKKMKGCLCSGR